MLYASQLNIVERYGDELLFIIASDENDGIDALSVNRALEDASAEIDTYVSAKYQLPFADVPAVLPRLCIDIAVYRLASSADHYSEEKRQRYDDAIKLLDRIARGIIRIGSTTPDTPGSDAPSQAAPAYFKSSPRLFGRDR